MTGLINGSIRYKDESQKRTVPPCTKFITMQCKAQGLLKHRHVEGQSRKELHKFLRIICGQGPGENDQSLEEKGINVVTSLPFLAVGAHTLRRRCPLMLVNFFCPGFKS